MHWLIKVPFGMSGQEIDFLHSHTAPYTMHPSKDYNLLITAATYIKLGEVEWKSNFANLNEFADVRFHMCDQFALNDHRRIRNSILCLP